LKRFDQPIQHPADTVHSIYNRLVIELSDVRKAQRSLELYINLALRAESDIKMIEVRLPSRATAAFRDIAWDRDRRPSYLRRQSKSLVGWKCA
jgi:hypothetical protein